MNKPIYKAMSPHVPADGPQKRSCNHMKLVMKD